MTRELADNLNRVGLVLGFLSFWFAAPEFIGEQRLKIWERTIANLLARTNRWAKRGKAPDPAVMFFLACILGSALLGRGGPASDLGDTENAVGSPALCALCKEPALSGVEGAGTTNACAMGFVPSEKGCVGIIATRLCKQRKSLP